MVGIINTSGTLVTTATMTSINDDGFTVNFTNVGGGLPWCFYKAYP